MPVHLIYRTAFTDAKGQIEYRRDIYGRDAQDLEGAAAGRGGSARGSGLSSAAGNARRGARA